jgi:hypothetical protein
MGRSNGQRTPCSATGWRAHPVQDVPWPSAQLEPKFSDITDKVHRHGRFRKSA